MIRIGILTVLMIALILRVASTWQQSQTFKHVDEFLKDRNYNKNVLDSIMKSGTMDGFFTADEVFAIFEHLLSKFPQHVSRKIIGQTIQGRDIPAYYLTNLKNPKNTTVKSKILFTGAHHARELITPSMTVRIFIETLYDLLHEARKHIFWNYSDIIIVPIVNVDSYKYISDSFGTPQWNMAKNKRKNMNPAYCPYSKKRSCH